MKSNESCGIEDAAEGFVNVRDFDWISADSLEKTNQLYPNEHMPLCYLTENTLHLSDGADRRMVLLPLTPKMMETKKKEKEAVISPLLVFTVFRHREFGSFELFGKYQTPLKSLAALTVTQNFCNNFFLFFLFQELEREFYDSDRKW